MLAENQIIELRNGNIGVVASFNDKPFQLIFTAYTNPISRYDANTLKHKNPAYDIIRVYDGSSIEDVKSVFRRSFKTEGLPVIWEGNN